MVVMMLSDTSEMKLLEVLDLMEYEIINGKFN